MTLVEVLVSAAILAILMGGMASAVSLASRALPRTGAKLSTSEVQASVADAMEQFEADLFCATSINELTATTISVTVPDRSHGSAGDETIRYAWSGVAGAALTRSYNGAPATTLVSNVSSFSVAGLIRTKPLLSPPRVMLVVGNSASLSANDTARVALLTQWQFPTTIVDDGASAAAFAAAATVSDVAWYGSDISALTIYGRLPNPSIGVVQEKYTLLNEFGFSSLPAQISDKKVVLLDVSHEITSVFSLGNLDVANNAQTLTYATGTRAPGGRVLAGRLGSTGDAMLMVIDVGGTLWNGQTSRSRRVELPWGGGALLPLDFSQLTSDAKWILKRSIVWAAAPVIYTRVCASLTAGRASPVTRTVDLLSQPGVSKP